MRGFNVGRSVRNVFSQARDFLEDRGLPSSATQTPEELVGQVQEEASQAIEDIPAPELSSSEVDPEGSLGAFQNKRKRERGRKAANLSPASGASILTGPR